MQTRFVVVPVGLHSPSGEGYDLYDTREKVRLSFYFPTRAEADYACAIRNDHQAASGSSHVGYG